MKKTSKAECPADTGIFEGTEEYCKDCDDYESCDFKGLHEIAEGITKQLESHGLPSLVAVCSGKQMMVRGNLQDEDQFIGLTLSLCAKLVAEKNAKFARELANIFMQSRGGNGQI